MFIESILGVDPLFKGISVESWFENVLNCEEADGCVTIKHREIAEAGNSGSRVILQCLLQVLMLLNRLKNSRHLLSGDAMKAISVI